MAKDVQKVFGQMIEDMYNMTSGEDLLETCMSLREEAIRRVPLRYRIIALGFVKHFTLDELNRKLAKQGCPLLYSRSFWEATLIFAFKNGISYDGWKEIQDQCRDIYGKLEDPLWFKEKKITYAALEDYVQKNSATLGSVMATEMRTQFLQQGLLNVSDDVSALRAFLAANIQSFSGVREKTRYYFCKYLYYWLNRRIENYFEVCCRGKDVDEALSELLCLKVVTILRRNPNMSEEKKRALIYSAALSCSEIFDAFNYYYFGYVSVDWVEALMECYESVEEIPAIHKANLAKVFRKDHPEWKKKSDDEVISLKRQETEGHEDVIYSREGNRGYGRNRDGENTLYKYIQGSRDIDRSVLICFLLFFASDGEMPDAHRLSVARLQNILAQCGYPALNTEDDFDWFIVEFLESRHPKAFLFDVMSAYAKHHENSFLYHIYGHAVQYEKELIGVLGKQEIDS